MKYTYEVIDTGLGGTILLRSDGTCIPMADDNSDYQAYLRWLNGEDESGTL